MAKYLIEDKDVAAILELLLTHVDIPCTLTTNYHTKVNQMSGLPTVEAITVIDIDTSVIEQITINKE